MSFDLYLMCCNIMIYEFKSNVNQGLLRKRDIIESVRQLPVCLTHK